MSKVIAIFVFIGVLFQSFSKVLIIADYYLNEDYIARNFCENKDKPQLHCNGKCYLKKELNKDRDAQNASFPKNLAEQFNITLFAETRSFILSSCFEYIPKQEFFSFQEDLICGIFKSIFHPPPFVF